MPSLTTEPSLLRAYVAVIGARYRSLLQYRAAAIAGFMTQLFWGSIKIMVLVAFYAASSEQAPMSLPMVITYVWLGQAMLGMLPWSIDGEIEQHIRTGAVVYELTRPLDLYTYWFCRTIALRTATTTLRSIPMLVFALWVLPLLGLENWSMQTPPSLASLLMFIVSISMALMIACAVTMLMHVVLVISISGEGLNRIMPSIVLALSGMLIPLPLFPDWMQGALNLQPFRGIVDVPYRIYMGHIDAFAAWPEILSQVLWATVLIVFGRSLLNRAMKNLAVQGG